MPLALLPLLLYAQAPPPPGPPPPPSWAATSPVGAPKAFEVASVKANKSATAMGNMNYGPGKLTLTSFTLEGLVTWAYSVKDYQIVGAPPGFGTDRYDVNAKAYGAPDLAHLKLLLQALLSERFKLALHRETRQLPVFQLTVDGKARMRPSSGPVPPDLPQISEHGGERGKQMTAQHATVKQLANALGWSIDRPLIDKTGLTGLYDFQLHWTPDENDPNGISLFTALKEQLGLKLESTKGPVEVLVIDHAERTPTPN